MVMMMMFSVARLVRPAATAAAAAAVTHTTTTTTSVRAFSLAASVVSKRQHQQQQHQQKQHGQHHQQLPHFAQQWNSRRGKSTASEAATTSAAAAAATPTLSTNEPSTTTAATAVPPTDAVVTSASPAAAATTVPPTDAVVTSASPAAAATTVPPTDAGLSTSDALSNALSTIDPQVLQGIARVGEVRELGLGAYYTPVGLLQNALELISAVPQVPWAVSIIALTFTLRTFLLPIVVKVMINNTKMANLRPEMELHTARMNSCRKAGDQQGALQATMALQNLFKTNDCHPLKSFAGLFAQGPIFISFFLALRKMSELPVESMKHGGFLWFQDLTVADPTYVLPVLASASMLATILLGADGQQTSQQKSFKYFIIALSLGLLPVTASFPAAIFLYWVPSNLFSLSQMIMLKNDAMRTWLKIPKPIVHPVNPAAAPSSGFMASMKNSFEAAKEEAETRERERRAKQQAQALQNMKIPKKQQ